MCVCVFFLNLDLRKFRQSSRDTLVGLTNPWKSSNAAVTTVQEGFQALAKEVHWVQRVIPALQNSNLAARMAAF